ncbi:hypothetical protein I7I50_08775 [Histoplasma capsulatum G186AR]|uniref:Uncharacterized protein n=1 Tax=Ajellomyces capsulatus TaxID=5037 RepID=A0A8H7YTB3_AJECA|nr:hypothetical protein I7I52_06289 [Histoplasma capsulatum]QSS73851.1 hypothetical protein I7I50_08775 [Histoplasma capsulatum G186AR]
MKTPPPGGDTTPDPKTQSPTRVTIGLPLSVHGRKQSASRSTSKSSIFTSPSAYLAFASWSSFPISVTAALRTRATSPASIMPRASLASAGRGISALFRPARYISPPAREKISGLKPQERGWVVKTACAVPAYVPLSCAMV